jgi:hypothetical protein
MNLTIPSPAAGTYYVELEDSAWIDSASQARDHMIKADVVPIAPPPCTIPIITSMTPTNGGTAGPVTVTINGQCLASNATVCLQRSGYADVCATSVTIAPDGRSATATFGLSPAPLGNWTLIVTNPDSEMAAAPTAFTIDSGGWASLWVEIDGRSTIRAGQNATYVVKCGNAGNVDASPVWLSLQTSATDVTIQPQAAALKKPAERLAATVLSDGTGISILLGYTGPLGPGQLIEFPITINVPIVQCVNLAVTPEDLKGKTCDELATMLADEYNDDYLPKKEALDALYIEFKNLGCTCPADDRSANFVRCDSLCHQIPYAESLVRKAKEGIARVCSEYGRRVDANECVPNASVTVICNLVSQNSVAHASQLQPMTGVGGSPGLPLSAGIGVCAVSSVSPEDKYGPSGYDASGTATNRLKRWLPADQVLDYRIDFWNKEDAPAATVDVFINDQLSSNLNWSTFKFTEIGFLDWRVPLEPCQYFNVDVPNVQIDLSRYYPGAPVVNLTVNVQGTFNATTGQITWEFHALDPITRQPPEEPLAGFLPPITTNGWEIGWVDFSAAPLAGLPTSTIISNQSYVKFDVDVFKPAPPGGPFVNTLDSLSPQSAVQPLPATVASSTFAVQWNGTDGPNGSGIRDYTIFVSENNGSYSNWLVNATTTSGTFTGQVGHTYAFYSTARDNVGNQEGKVALPEATTRVVSTQVLNISKLQTKLNFAKANADSCSLTATLDPGAGFNPSGKSVMLDIGGAQMSFTLDSKGRIVGSPGACRLSYSKSKKVWTFTAKLKGGNYQTAWEAYGMVNANLPQPTAAVSLPVTLLLDQETFVGEKILTYKAKPGKSGTAK